MYILITPLDLHDGVLNTVASEHEGSNRSCGNMAYTEVYLWFL